MISWKTKHVIWINPGARSRRNSNSILAEVNEVDGSVDGRVADANDKNIAFGYFIVKSILVGFRMKNSVFKF